MKERTKLARSLALTLFLALASSSALAQQSSHDPDSGYLCEFEHHGSFGIISSRFKIYSKSKLNTMYIKWIGRDGPTSEPRISATWFRRSDGTFALGEGRVTFAWHIWDRQHRPSKPLELSLELSPTISPAPQVDHYRGKVKRSGGPFYLSLPWDDVAKLAKDAENLHLIARNARLEIVDRFAIDGASFGEAEPYVQSAFDTVNEMIADPTDACTYHKDLHFDEITVT